MTRSNNGMKIRTRRGFSTCNTMVKKISYKYFIISVSMCSYLLLHILSHIQRHFSQTKYKMIPYLLVTLYLFPLHSTLVSRYLKEPVSFWTCVSVNQSGLPFSLVFSISTAQRKMSWPGETEGRIGDYWTKRLKKELRVTKEQRFWLCCSYNKAFYFLWQYFHYTVPEKKVPCLYFSCELKTYSPWSWAGATYLTEDVKEKCGA